MTTEKLLHLFDQLEKRLTAIAGQAKDASDRARESLELVEKLRLDLAQLKKQVVATVETRMHTPLPMAEQK
jgi:hypothetical protein